MIYLAAVLGSLATYRLTRLIIQDEILASAREKIFKANKPTLAYFITCPWCVSMWVGFFLATLFFIHQPTFFFTALALSFSAVAGMLYEKL